MPERLLRSSVIVGLLCGLGACTALASDHLDTTTLAEHPGADIGDLYAWTTPDRRHLNLVMTIVGKRFSDKLRYVFHVDSGKRFGATTATTEISCRFDAAGIADCRAGDADHVRGDASQPAGVEGRNGRFRVFAGLRDDPFFNNVSGSRAAFEAARIALQSSTQDAAGCPQFDRSTSRAVLDQWRHTNGGPPLNFLAGWSTAALVVSIDLDIVDGGGGELLAIWASTNDLVHDALIDRMGRALTANALIQPLGPVEASDRLKDQYNRAAAADWDQYAADIRQTLGLLDAFDGECGNQWLAGRGAEPPMHYQELARLLADDRLWVHSAATDCIQYMAVERAELAAPGSSGADCGGRAPGLDATDAFRSLLVSGNDSAVSDGVDRDDRAHSPIEFPFLAAP